MPTVEGGDPGHLKDVCSAHEHPCGIGSAPSQCLENWKGVSSSFLSLASVSSICGVLRENISGIISMILDRS